MKGKTSRKRREKDERLFNGILREDEVTEYNNYLLQRFNDYELPLQMTPEEIREKLIEFLEEYK